MTGSTRLNRDSASLKGDPSPDVVRRASRSQVRHASRSAPFFNLCFHGIGVAERVLEPSEDTYWVSLRRFEEILDVVVRHPATQLTFDDGNRTDVTIALPALRERGLAA